MAATSASRRLWSFPNQVELQSYWLQILVHSLPFVAHIIVILNSVQLTLPTSHQTCSHFNHFCDHSLARRSIEDVSTLSHIARNGGTRF